MEKILKWKNENVCKFNMTDYGYLIDIPKLYNRELLPLGVKMEGEIVDSLWMSAWWKNNSIPAERDSIRLGLECVGVTSEDELKLLCRGLSLTNNYWLCDPNETLRWEEINFWDNGFSDEVGRALFSHRPLHKNVNFKSPDASLNGMLKKTWVDKEGEFYLAKGGSGSACQEVFNEKIASDLLKLAAAEHVEYQLGMCDNKICCLAKCMTDRDTELIHASQIFESIPRKGYPDHENELDYFKRTLEYYDIRYDSEQLDKMLCIDYMIANTDRHYNNIGILENKNTGERKLSPIFDNGTSLWCQTPAKHIQSRDDSIMARPFCNKTTFGSWQEQVCFIHSYPEMDSQLVKSAIVQFGKDMKMHSDISTERIEALTTGLAERIAGLQEILKEKGIKIPEESQMNQNDVQEVQKHLRSASGN